MPHPQQGQSNEQYIKIQSSQENCTFPHDMLERNKQVYKDKKKMPLQMEVTGLVSNLMNCNDVLLIACWLVQALVLVSYNH